MVFSEYFAWVFLPLLIFFARVLDVSLGIIRVIFITKGFRNIAPVIAFFEVLIWIVAISQVMNNFGDFWLVLAYSFGFAAGTYVGIVIEDRLSIGKVRITVVAKKSARDIIGSLKSKGFVVTVVKVEGSGKGARKISLLLDRSKVNSALKLIRAISPNVFYSVDAVRSVRDDVTYEGHGFFDFIRVFPPFRKSK
jgi:uncharacterized protein YebE (UPF0316 family)